MSHVALFQQKLQNETPETQNSPIRHMDKLKYENQPGIHPGSIVWIRSFLLSHPIQTYLRNW